MTVLSVHLRFSIKSHDHKDFQNKSLKEKTRENAADIRRSAEMFGFEPFLWRFALTSDASESEQPD